jgi:hypothetical protein
VRLVGSDDMIISRWDWWDWAGSRWDWWDQVEVSESTKSNTHRDLQEDQ